jgi:fructose-bisphosphate aldolase class II
MKIITRKEDVLARLAAAAADQVPLFCPNGETVDEIEGILSAADTFQRQQKLQSVTLAIGVTGSYPDHPQLKRLAFDSDLAADGSHFLRTADSIESRAFIWLDWLGVYANQPHLFPAVEVIPFLDHGWAPSSADLAVMQNPDFQRRMGIIMFDASSCSLEENIARTAEYVSKAGTRVVVEACPDKILSAQELHDNGSGGNILTDPVSAEKFVRATGVDLIVPSLGTEHRGVPGESIFYRRGLAQDLRQRVGRILALHGTSSLGDGITHVGQDGIVKVNFYTGMARAASEAVRSHWTGSEINSLKIETAAGSYIHNHRRQEVRKTCLRMLHLLRGAGSADC